MGYYDIDDILADAVEIPCRFNYEIPGLGYLEGNPGKAISKKSKIQLPIWLARILAIVGGDSENGEDMDGSMSVDGNDMPFVELLQPEFLSAKVINAIKTSPETLDLHSINSHFINIANKWITLFGDKNLSNILNDLLLQRSIELNSHASSVMINISNKQGRKRLDKDNNFQENNINTPFLLTMDEFEKHVYKKSHSSYKDTKKWLFEP